MDDIHPDRDHQEEEDCQDHQEEEEDLLAPLVSQETKDPQDPLDHKDSKDHWDLKDLWDHRDHLDRVLDHPTYLDPLPHHR